MDVKSDQAIQTGLSDKHKGMTLLEVVLALALSSLFFCCLLDFTSRGVNLHTRTLEEMQLRKEMSYMRLFIQDQFDQARLVTFYGEGDETLYTNVTPSELTIDEEKVLKKIVFDQVHSLQISKEKKVSNNLFKMTYEGKTLIENIQNISVIQRDDRIFITCTLVGRGNTVLTEDILLNTTYKYK